MTARPLSIKLIAGWYLWGFLWSSIRLIPKIMAVVSSLSGPFLLSYHMLATVAELYFAIGLWHLNDIARRVAIGYQLYFATVWSISLAVPSARREAAMQAFASRPEVSEAMRQFSVYVGSGGLIIISMVIIWFLIRRKSAFVASRN